MNFNRNKDAILTTIFAICLFFVSNPFYVWHTHINIFLSIICALISIIFFKTIDNKKFAISIAFVFVFLYIGFKDESNYISFFLYIIILTQLVTPTKFIYISFEKFIYLYSISLIPSIIIFVFVNFFGFGFSYSIIEPLNPTKLYYYFQYPFLVQSSNAIESIIPRFCGYYDEPGVIGTISAALLICTGFDLKKKINIPIFISGVLSFSLAFYFTMIVYLMVFSKVKYRIMIIFILFILYSTLAENDIFKFYLLNRIEINDGDISGNNRVDDNFESWYTTFSTSAQYYFGVGSVVTSQFASGSSSYKVLIANYGIIFFIYLISLLIIRAFLQIKFNKNFIKYIIIIALIIYQRPSISDYFYFFLLIASSIYLIIDQKSKLLNVYTSVPLKVAETE